MKKMISMLLAVLLLISAFPVAFASESYPIEAHFAATGSHSVKTLTIDSGERITSIISFGIRQIWKKQICSTP